MEKKDLQFKFSGKMARLLGRESVSSDTAALFELIKNSYDADASLVTINFENFDKDDVEDARIILEDDGDGMSLKDMEKKWMIIGTDFKEREQVSKKGRRVIGNKGVGRFATEKLCNKATIISKSKDDNKKLQLEIDWRKYEKQNITFSDIKNPLEITDIGKEDNTGIKIILEDLRGIWNTEKINDLKLSVGSLVMPKKLQRAVKDSFNIDIFAKDFDIEIIPEISNSLLSNALYRISSKIHKGRNDAEVRIYKENKIIKTEQIDLKEVIGKAKEVWEQFGPCKVEIYVYPDRTQYEDWSEHYKKIRSANNISKLLKSIHGVKIYRDDFWVRPYGDISDDWLGLEAARVQANYKIGNSQIIGFVEITKEDNQNIIDTTTREKLVENNVFKCMRLYVKEVINSMNNYRKDENKRLREMEIKYKHNDAIKKHIKNIREFIEKAEPWPNEYKKDIKYELTKVNQIFVSYKREIDATTEDLKISERAYRNLASLGISTAATSHEISHIIPQLNMILNNVLANIKKLPDIQKETIDDLNRAIEKINAIRHFSSFIIRFLENVAYDNEIKHQKETMNLVTDLKEVIKEFSSIVLKVNNKIDLNLSSPRILVHMNKSDFESIILNFLSNSIKAMEKIQSDKWKIKISIIKDSTKLSIKFSDNGKGIREAHRDKIFRMFFTTNKSNGTGLGLTIIREIVEEYGGTIDLKPHSEFKNGATFVITIPLERLKK